MKKNEKENLKEFVKRLSELEKEFELYIYGCGCCGSPSIINEDNLVLAIGYDRGDYLEEEEGIYIA